MTFTKLIVAVAALSFVAVGAADAAGKPKRHKKKHPKRCFPMGVRPI